MANDPADGHHLTITGHVAVCACEKWSNSIIVMGDLDSEAVFERLTTAHKRHLERVRNNWPGRPQKETKP
jgi:hypothetical protein